ncbi:sensor histidine kinase [Paenibacillus sp. FSL P2-0089]|uniref:sensor histidine kinase n=1 Tax=Paenibacillus sp. FSL P2-0089 TaxID=2954526 RepID=UPI00315A635B
MIPALFITLLVASVVLWLNSGNASFRWFSIALFASSSSIITYLLSAAYPQTKYDVWINTLYAVSDATIAYTFGIFGAVYSDLLNRRQRRMYGIILIIAALAGIAATPLTPGRLINYSGRNELPMLLFIGCALGISAVLLILANLREKHPFKRRERMLTNMLALPVMMYIIVSYAFYMRGIDLFQFNHLVSIGFLSVFLLIGLTRGILGVRFKVEMLKIDASLHTLKGGSHLLNHTIKNEIGKIDILLHQIRRELQSGEQTGGGHRETLGMVASAAESIGHVQNMMGKINESVQAIDIQAQTMNPAPVLEACLAAFARVAPPEIHLHHSLHPVQDVYFDPLHLKEMLTNLLNNAAEAIEHQGAITVRLSETSREAVISIQDSGKGIPQTALPYIFDPFYSTKKMTAHYGLGLYYCKNVMMKLDGSIRVESEPGQGTCFYLYLRKIKRSSI